MNVRIVERPSDEAPDDVRDAWIGLSLPVLQRYSRAVERRGFGVLSGPRNRLEAWVKSQAIVIKKLVGNSPRARCYMVDTTAAVDLLEKENPMAAAWWRTNATHLFKPGFCLLFEEECCAVEVQDNKNSK